VGGAGCFNVRELAVSSAAHAALSPYETRQWIRGGILERWLLEAGIARPNGPGRLELTPFGVELVEAVANLRPALPEATDAPWPRQLRPTSRG
jgi:hypothetical protein